MTARGGRRRRWERRAMSLVVLAFAAMLAACGSDGGDGDARHGGVGPQPVGERRDLSAPGVHELADPPLAGFGDDRTIGVTVVLGDRVLWWGGERAQGDSSPGRQVGDGAVLSLADGRWTPMPASPFPHGLYHPAAAWDGDEVVVIGTSCEAELPPSTDGSPPACPEGPAAAAFDPTSATWRRLTPPPIPLDESSKQAVLRRSDAASGSGWALFADRWGTAVIVWDRSTASWRSLDAPFAADVDADVCVDEQRAEVIASWSPQPGVDEPVRLRRLDVEDGTWGPLVEVNARGWVDGCGDGLIAVTRYDGDEGRALTLVDATSGRSLERFVDPRLAREQHERSLVGAWLIDHVTVLAPATGELATANRPAPASPSTTTSSSPSILGPDAEAGAEAISVRLARDADGAWSRIDEGSGGDPPSFGWTEASVVPGVGFVATVTDSGDGPHVVFWRAPDDLVP